MNKEQKLEAIEKAMEFTGENPEKGTRANIYIINEKCDDEVRKFLIDLMHDSNIGGTMDLNYEITAKACELFCDIESIKDLEDEENACEAEVASVYTADRLAYLNNSNEVEISETMKEYDCEDISTGCAIWYDNMVRQAYEEIKNWILKD